LTTNSAKDCNHVPHRYHSTRTAVAETKDESGRAGVDERLTPFPSRAGSPDDALRSRISYCPPFPPQSKNTYNSHVLRRTRSRILKTLLCPFDILSEMIDFSVDVAMVMKTQCSRKVHVEESRTLVSEEWLTARIQYEVGTSRLGSSKINKYLKLEFRIIEHPDVPANLSFDIVLGDNALEPGRIGHSLDKF
jgi:hypothetical protein